MRLLPAGSSGHSSTPQSRLREHRSRRRRSLKRGFAMITFLLWVILLLLCWPLALAALLLYPIIWLLLLPFRIVGIAVGGVLELIWALVTLPARLVRSLGRA